MTDFESLVIRELSEIKSMCATQAQASKDFERRVEVIETKFTTEDNRHWIKSMVMSAILLIAHPLIRKMGWDV
jgi:hypothetical protein